MAFKSFNDPELFSERPLDNHLGGMMKSALASVQAFGRRALLDADGEPDPQAVDALVASVCASHSVQPIVFHFDAAEATELTEDEGVIATSIVLPFSGYPALLRLNANHRFVVDEEPRGNVVEATEVDEGASDRLVFWLRSPNLDTQFNELLKHRFDQLKSKTDWTNQLVAQWNDSLEPAVRRAANERATILARMAATEAALPVPIRRVREPAIALPIQRKALKAPDNRTASVGVRPRLGASSEPDEWTMADAVYEEVVRTLVLFAAAAGRLPASTGKLSENDLRNFALLVLNANFDLTAARGEVFNGNGKTDLLVPWHGHNAFVGEFKKYRGPQSVSDALTQLLGYVTWADTAAALVIIIEGGDVAHALTQIHMAVSGHDQHLRAVHSTDPNQRRDYLVKSLQAREVRLAVIPIVVNSQEARGE